ncbi:hypothetical protein C8J57DRAFT_1476622 [Mycena rebaudengoi]|nr:hypothetical protein C8J57DRAFT_1476622 [Mycena rebaudengoi]
MSHGLVVETPDRDTRTQLHRGYTELETPRQNIRLGPYTGPVRVAGDLFDLIIELRPSSTPGGLAENIKPCTKANATPGPFSTPSSEPLSSPIEEGYNDTSITDDMIREVYMSFVERTHSEESDECLLNLSPRICLSADNTFKAAGKATVADSSKARSKLVKSTLSFLNEGNEIVAGRFCQSASPAEMREVLEGFKKRCVELNVDLPGMMVVDNCC